MSAHTAITGNIIDPALARALMMRVKPREMRKVRARLSDLWTGANTRTAILGSDDEDRGSLPAIVKRAVAYQAERAN